MNNNTFPYHQAEFPLGAAFAAAEAGGRNPHPAGGPTAPIVAAAAAGVRRRSPRWAGAFLAASWLVFGVAGVLAQSYTLGTTNVLEGPAAGTDSVVLGVTPATQTWTATANAGWLHLSAANQSGAGSTSVVFTFDANPGATRTGTFAVAGQAVTVTQAGATYAAANPLTTLVSSGLSSPRGVAVDGAGNVYIADYANNAIKKWVAASGTVITLVSSGLYEPFGVAVDSAGNVYFSDSGNNAIKKWTAATGMVATLVSSGLDNPSGVAVDGAGNVYIADYNNNAIKEWVAASGTVATLVSSGLSAPRFVAVDAAGNVYIDDSGNNAIKEWAAVDGALRPLVSALSNNPRGVAVDGGGNVYIVGNGDGTIIEWRVAGGTLATLVASGLNTPSGAAVDGAGNVYIACAGNNAIEELPRAFVDPTAKTEPAAAGSDVLPVVLPATESLGGPLAPTSDESWLTITGITNGVVSCSFTANPGLSRTAHITLLGAAIAINQAGTQPDVYALGTTNLVEGPTAGADSVVLAVTSSTGSWTATANAAWLHLSAANQSGAGSTNVVFTFDANPGATRTGTLTIDGMILTVTQAGVSYVPANPLTTLAPPWGWVYGLAVDGAGNVYIADYANNTIDEWKVATGTVTTRVSSGLFEPSGVAVDGAGNVYFTDYGNLEIEKWTAATDTLTTLVASGSSTLGDLAVDAAGNVYISNFNDWTINKWTAATATVTTLVSSGLANPSGVAVDGAGNVYFADTSHNAIKKWTAAGGLVITLVSSGLDSPRGVAVDAAGNVYIADTDNGAIKRWTAATGMVTTLVSSGLDAPEDVAVDGAGNVYIAEYSDSVIKRWTAATGTLTTLVSPGLKQPRGVAVDPVGNVYVGAYRNHAIKELTRAFVDSTARMEPVSAGSDVLLVVLPATENLTGPFAPVSDQAWLTITGITNGVVSFAFPANPSASRTAHIQLLGQSIVIRQSGLFTAVLGATNLQEGAAAGTDSVALAVSSPLCPWTATANDPWLHLDAANQSGTGSTNVIFSYDANTNGTRIGTLSIAGQTLTVTQAGAPNELGTTTLLEGSAAGADSVLVAVRPSSQTWTAVANDSWLHLDPAYQTGSDSTNVVFTFDANPGATRAGTLTVAGQTLTVTQAGSTYVAASSLLPLVAAQVYDPSGLAVDRAGNLYFCTSNAIQEWTPTTGAVTTLVPEAANALAVDGVGNVYFLGTDTDWNPVIKEWTAADGVVTTLVGSGLNWPTGLAVDRAGNVYIADDGMLLEWTAATGALTGLYGAYGFYPSAVAVDAADEVYLVDRVNCALETWSPTSLYGMTWLWSSGLYQPTGLAVDGGGNVYIYNQGNSLVTKWTVVSDAATTLFAGNGSVAVDGAGNVYFANTDTGEIEELPRAFVDPRARSEGAAAGTDVLPVVLPATANLAGSFAPTSDSAWLTITGVTDGVVSFAFTANPTHVTRTGHITLLGQAIPITQAGAAPLAADLTSPVRLPGGNLQFSFTGTAGASYSVLFSTNMALPLTAWTVAGTATEITPGQFQFTATPSPAAPSGFYRVRSP